MLSPSGASGLGFQLRWGCSPCLSCSRFDAMLRWESMTPLGRPVVPEEYTKNARSLSASTFVRLYLLVPAMFRTEEKCLKRTSGSFLSPMRMMRSSGMPASFAALIAMSSWSHCVTRAFAPLFLSWNESSSTLYPGLAGETIPPAQSAPHVTIGVSMQLGV